MAAPSAVQSRLVVDRSLIFLAAGVLEQICACASGRGHREDTRLARGSTIPDHAPPSQIDNLASLVMSPARSPRVLADAPP
ncbi:hypothetical protein OAO87_02945 [bacterium]|nr:hypothetical protein [bacterium]